MRSVTARLHLGTHEAVLGVPACELIGRIVPLEDLWGREATRRLLDQLGDARTTADAAMVLESAVERRLAASDHRLQRHAHAPPLALAAAERLTRGHVGVVALDLGVSERHLRRVFGEALGVSPKAYARLSRFRRALSAARKSDPVNWASIAAEAGYYDQAHLISEFRAVAGVTPSALLAELSAARSLG